MTNQRRIQLLRIIAPIAALAVSFLVGALLLLLIGKSPILVYTTMLQFNFGRIDSLGAILFNATPLIFSGLAVAVGFKVGLFNIGVEGQYFIGAFLAGLVGFSVTGLPAALHIALAIAAAVAGAAAWAFLPVWLKLRRGVHEVISTIMLNYVAYSLFHFLITDVFLDRNQKIPEGLGSPLIRTPKFVETVMMPKLNGLFSWIGIDMPNYVYLNGFFLLALLTAGGVYYLLWRMPLGYEIRAVGHSPAAAEAAGINPAAIRCKAFLLSGVLAGLVGLSHLLSYYDALDLDFPKNFGFNGIAVALMGANHPGGIILSALLFGFLNRGAEGIQTFLNVPMEIVIILQAIIILSVVATSSVMERRIRRLEKEAA